PPAWAMIPVMLAWVVGIVHAFKDRREVRLRLKYASVRAADQAPLPTAWRYWAFVPNFAWAAWLHAAIRSRHALYYFFAALYAVPFFVAMSSKRPDIPGWVPTLIMVVWVVGILHTMMWSKVVGARIQQQQEGVSGEDDLERRIRTEYLSLPPEPEPVPAL